MRKELSNDFDHNEPYRNLFDLTIWQTFRLRIYKVITVPDFNLLSKVLYCGDLLLTLIPIGMLYVQLINPRINLQMQPIIWFLVSYFSAEYLLGLLTCKNKIKFLFNGWHLVELISFLPWVIYNLVDWSNDRNHSSALEPFLVSDDGAIGFFLLRILRVSKLPDVISCTWLKEDIDIYVKTVNLAFTSYKPMAFSLFFLILFLSTLIYAFERGHWNGEIWIRGEETEGSPFSNFFNCIWYTIVTGTTLGYGDLYPISYEGKLVGILILVLGLINLTVIINTIGQCFEEIFRDYLEDRSIKIQAERSRYIKRQVEAALGRLEDLRRSKTSFRRSVKKLG